MVNAIPRHSESNNATPDSRSTRRATIAPPPGHESFELVGEHAKIKCVCGQLCTDRIQYGVHLIESMRSEVAK